MAETPEKLAERARLFAEWDVNPGTRALTLEMLARNDPAELAAHFGGRLEFGTAGLRGPMGVGSNRMNDLTVLQAAQGLVTHLMATFGESAWTRGVAVGFDHRASGSLNSRRFALLTAAACIQRGIRVHLFSRLVATPVLAFSIHHVGACAGVMVTASHNPKHDNGYKVYASNGAQIISPIDKQIAAAIEANQAPWDKAAYIAALADESKLWANPLVMDPTELVVESYLAKVAGTLCRCKKSNATSPLRIAYTAMHGVGHPYAAAAFDAFGLPPFVPVAEQIEPDPDFPTVAFPNPEEGKGALSLAMATAEREGASLILANDPDADRLAVAEFVPAAGGVASAGSGAEGTKVLGPGEWRIFTGNEIGALLAAWMWRGYTEAGGDPRKAVMIASTVSSKLIAAMAKAEGFTFTETLTGFKWMGNAMSDLLTHGRCPIFAFEEAIGFSCGAVVNDKDGVSAAAVFAEMANQLARQGKTVSQQLMSIYDRYGYFGTNNGYVFVDDPAKTQAIFDRLRNEGHYWGRLTPGIRIVGLRDLTSPGYDSEQPDGNPVLPTSNGSHMITFKFSNSVLVTLRTSGTEPKLKWYSEGQGEPGVDRAVVDATVSATVAAVLDEMIRPEMHMLKRPRV